MAQRKILKMGDPQLNMISSEIIDILSEETQCIIDDMRETMIVAKGAGIAAPQIGVLSRIILYGFEANPRYPDVAPIPERLLINPEIEILDEETVEGWEGCLSVPGLRGKVPRFKKIRVSAQDQSGSKIIIVAEDFHARVIQHEFDHLEGVLYPQRITDLTQFGFIEELEKRGVIPKLADS